MVVIDESATCVSNYQTTFAVADSMFSNLVQLSGFNHLEFRDITYSLLGTSYDASITMTMDDCTLAPKTLDFQIEIACDVSATRAIVLTNLGSAARTLDYYTPRTTFIFTYSHYLCGTPALEFTDGSDMIITWEASGD